MRSHNKDALQAATEWYLQLTSGDATEADHQAWKDWKQASIEHEKAWGNIEAVTHPFTTIDAAMGLVALDRVNGKQYGSSAKPVSNGRRQALKHLGILIAVGTSAWIGYRQKPWQGLLADYTTQIGENRQFVLEDGTRLFLNTDSMVAVDFSGLQRVVTLYQGEVLIETGHEHLETYRPFILQTQHGAITALGTRFSVRRHDAHTKVNLFEGSLRIEPSGSQSKLIITAGESVEFSNAAILQKGLVTPGVDAWSTGFLIVDKMPLENFLSELTRYRPGTLRCDPEIAKLRISGAFPIHDTDAVLMSIAKTLPIRIETFTRYWTVVKPA